MSLSLVDAHGSYCYSIREKIVQIRTHIHTKIHTQKKEGGKSTKHKNKKTTRGWGRKEEKGEKRKKWEGVFKGAKECE